MQFFRAHYRQQVVREKKKTLKVFVGGLSWDTTKDTLLAYFSQYGEVVDCVVMKNQQTGKSRGFGFVTYRDVSCVETVLSVPSHIVDGRQVDPKACNPKGLLQRQGDQGPLPRQNSRGQRGGQDAFKDKKIFIGGLPNSVDEEFLKSFFSKYGRVIDLSIMYDQQQNRSREKMRLGILCELTARQKIHMKCQVLFSPKRKKGTKVECKRAEPRSKPEGQDKEGQLQIPGLPIQHLEMAGGPPPQQQAPAQPPEGQWPPPDSNWAPGGQVPSSVAAPPNYQNVPFQGGYQEQPGGLPPTGWPPQQQPPQQGGAGSWPPAGPPPGQQPPPGSAPFVGQPPATQVYTSPQGQSPAVAPAYQWSSPPGQVPPGSGQPPQGVAVGQTPQGTYGAYVPVSAAPQQTPTLAPPIRPYGEFAANGQAHVSPAPGAQLPVSSPQNFPAYASPYGAPVSQANSTTPTDPYAQPAVVPTPGAAIQIPGVPTQAQPQPVPGYGSTVTPGGAVGSVTDPAVGTVKPAEYASYYGTYGAASQYTGVESTGYSAGVSTSHIPTGVPPAFPQGGTSFTSPVAAPVPSSVPGAASQYTGVESTGYSAGVSTSHIPTGVPPAFPQGGTSFTSPVAAPVPSSVPGYTGDATAAAYGGTPSAQNPYGSPTEAPQPVAYGGAPGPSPTFQRQGSGTQAYHPYRR